MDVRELKALELAARAKIVWDGGAWVVPSQSTGGTYRVTTWPGAEKCPCEDFQLRQAACKHVIAAKLVEVRDGRRKAPPIDTDVVPKKPTYPQNWLAYDKAQTEEKHRLQVLLADLSRGVPEPPPPKTGRRPVAIADRLFATVFKVYCGLSTRRYVCDMNDAHESGHLSRPVHYSKVCAFLANPDLTAPLRSLVEQSALPLRAIETDFAVDSSGFSTCKFVRWFDDKYGVERSGHDWVKVHIATGVRTNPSSVGVVPDAAPVKVHIATGVRTNVVTAIEIKGRDANDSPLLPALVRTTAANFTVGEVSADKGYLSAANVEAVVGLGGAAFIAPKANTTGNAGGEFQKMYHFYAYRRDEFLRHYHKRSNVESTFSAVKRKFGDAIRSKNETAMVNEVLAKFVCHNLCCVILSQIELGIEPEFWPQAGQDDAPRDVLRMPIVQRG